MNIQNKIFFITFILTVGISFYGSILTGLLVLDFFLILIDWNLYYCYKHRICIKNYSSIFS